MKIPEGWPTRVGPCAKKQVVCVIITKDWEEFRGENDCANPQPVCPRVGNEDYLKCRIICKQSGHAEIMALQAAGDKARGGDAMIYGIDNVCKSCQKALFAAGVESITIWNPNEDRQG